MSTKALKKELMAAVVMLLVAAIALSGSTFAWFAQNGSVEAKNMNVTVKSDMSFLLIAQGEQSATTVQEAKATVTDAAITTAALYPSQYFGTITQGALSGIDYDELATDSAWYYRYSTDPAISTGVTDKTTLSAVGADMSDYVLVNDFTLTVAKGSTTLTSITCAAVITTSATNASTGAVKVLVVTSEGAVEFGGEGGSSNATLAAVLSDADVMLVKVYVFWDGDNTAVFTNNIESLKETKVSVTFSGTPESVS